MIKIQQYEHVGIRISHLETALAFYQKLGFDADTQVSYVDYQAVELINDSDIRINLLVSTDLPQNKYNILIDAPEKHTGITHVAFTVADINATQKEIIANGITITEGPLKVGTRRRLFFIRDPDGNIIEFDQLLD